MVTFYHLDDTGTPDYPVLYLDTLKVSTIEQTAETAEARGGKGNPPIIIWDYNKEINVTLEDALFSAKSMAIMFGNGTVKNYAGTSEQPKFIMKTEMFNIGELTSENVNSKNTINEVLGITNGKVDSSTKSLGGWSTVFTAPDGHTYYKQNPKFYTADGVQITKIATAAGGQPADVFWPVNGVTLTTNDGTKGKIIAAGEKIFCSYDLAISGSVIEISANSFPGTWTNVMGPLTGSKIMLNQSSELLEAA